MPLVHLSDGVTIAVDVAAWAAIHAATGYAAHRIPASRLQRDSWLTRARGFERDGRVYESFAIKRWKDRLPEAGALFAGGVSKRSLPSRSADGLRRLAVETRRAEIGHSLAAAASPLFVLWNPPLVAVAMVIYGVAVNAPFIAIQRYNRLRISRALARSRSSRGTTGNNIP
jgi:glycosyl-4,4'-diaponeurosporenoate acyltransferase